MPAIVENVVYQHAENVCSLWLQRQQAVDEPHYSFADLVHLDNRVDANLDGLRIAGDAGLAILQSMLDAEEEGSCFALSLLAIESGNKSALSFFLDSATDKPAFVDELVSAFAWSYPANLKDIVKQLLSSASETSLVIGLLACGAHDRVAEDVLLNCLEHPSTKVRSAALKVGANLGNQAFNSQLLDLDAPEDSQEAFEHARAVAFSGKNQKAAEYLKKIALSDSPFQSEAVDLAMQLPDSGFARSLLKTLNDDKSRVRDVVRGFGLLGDPSAMSWLIDKTEDAELARQAGGSISMITGVDLALADLETLDEPEGFEAALNDDPLNENVALDEDENLPWPDTELIKQWWQSASQLPVGVCHINGREKKPAELQHVLITAMQRQRNAAANALAVRSPGRAYGDTRLPTARQRSWIS